MKRREYRIQLWLAPHAPIPQALQRQWLGLLAPDERERWQCFVREEDRLAFLQGKALTRIVVGEWLGQAPEQLVFHRDEYGKPHLARENADSPLHFNLSHTRGMAVLALSDGPVPGVDVESVQRPVEALALARRYFSANEVSALEHLEGQALQELFFRIWTLKEAWLKAKGLGLRLPLDAFSVDPSRSPPAISFSPLLDEDAAAWQLRLYTEAEYRIALALYCPAVSVEPELRYWQPGDASPKWSTSAT